MHVLLVDFDHTLYPASLPTLTRLDSRITQFIEGFLNLPPAQADAMRREFCLRHGTTLRGLMVHHQLNPHTYFDFIHQVEDEVLPPPNPALNRWLEALPYPAYIFTNARADWVEKCLVSMQLTHWVGEGQPLLGILDLAFMQWVGKPHPSAFAATDKWIKERHGQDAILHLIDDRLDNLATAHKQGWQTHWIQMDSHIRIETQSKSDRPDADASQETLHPQTRVWPSLQALDVSSIENGIPGHSKVN